VSFYAPIACQSARPINLLIARLALALCTQGHSGWPRDFERQARLVLEIDVSELLRVTVPHDETGSSTVQGGGKRRGVTAVDRSPPVACDGYVS
jgi:hypothetical protein